MDPSRSERTGAADVGFGAGIPAAPRTRGAAGSAEEDGAARPPRDGATGRSRRGPDVRSDRVRELLDLGPLRRRSPSLEDLAGAVDRAFEGVEGDDGTPPLPSRERVLAAAEAAVAADPGFGMAPLFTIRPHWSEPVASWAGRVVAALERGARVVVVTSRTLAGLAEQVAAELSAAVEPDACSAVVDPQYDLVRRIAAMAGVEVDLMVPDAFATGLVRGLEQARAAAAPDESPAADALRARIRGAFGAGVVDADRAALRIRRAEGRSLAYAAGDATARSADVAIDASVGPVDAAREAARLAFGPEAIGGYATDAVARVHVGARALSAFTAALLDALDGAELRRRPPAWTRADPSTERADGGAPRRARRAAPITARLDAAVIAARRVGLDEGATLIHDDRTPGAHALVFTNVEPRMRLGSTLRAPATLALLRVRD